MSVGGITFANTAVLWGLLALPALVAVHFFQQRSRRLETSTRFLIESLAPESAGGRTWERFRGSRTFWLQLLALVLAIWVLAEPRWPRADSTQTVALVLDDAVAMRAVADEARAAARGLMDELAAGAAKTEWVLMTSDPRRPALYRGAARAGVEAALAAWRPALGTHDYLPALRLGRGLAGAGGVCWFVTDRESKAPADQAAIGVGRELANAGFAGGEVAIPVLTGRATSEGARIWRAVVKNHSGEAQARAWWIETEGGASERRTVELGPDAVVELSGAWPARAERATLRLEADGFEADDALPLVRPESKRLSARVNVAGEAGAFFRKVLGGIDGVELGASLSATLRVFEEAETITPASTTMSAGTGPAVVLAAAGNQAERRLLGAPLVAERHPLVDGLNWQGLLGAGPAGLPMADADEGLLWQGDEPLVWLRAGEAGRRALVLNLEWATGNAGRLPAMVLMLRRYVEMVRDAQAGAYAANFDAGGLVPLAEVDRGLEKAGAEWSVEAEAGAGATEGNRRKVEVSELAVLRAPVEAGFFFVRRGDEVLVRGAAQFADARQGDFRGAGRFRREASLGEAEAARARNTQGDPLAAGWLALAAAALAGSWWPSRTRSSNFENWPSKSAEGAKNRRGAPQRV